MKFLLTPFSWIYGIVVAIRNMLFDANVLKRRSFNIPVISVGNITMCGTGKTPHTEYLVELLKTSTKLAVLSRGYKRTTKGYVVAREKTQMTDIGDEPFQMHLKYPDLTVAVCEDRCKGIDYLIEGEQVEAVILDDAFQHRYVNPGLNILLTDFNRMMSRDHLLPLGTLREPMSSKKRADIIIVTKCPNDLNPLEIRVATNEIRPLAFQKLFFSTIIYQTLQPLFDTQLPPKELITLKGINVLLITAIGSPDHIVNDLAKYDAKFRELHFRDHHQFSDRDILNINEMFSFLPQPRIIITTEKDATRMRGLNGFTLDVKKSAYYLPIKTEILLNKKEMFNNLITDYVHKNSTNISLAARKDAIKTDNGDNPGQRTRTISFRDYGQD